eukprot:Hpha_TRINITY_DN16686_c4_g2::TRINITY_DN16686_c4_g2_i10::g.180105::m.180105
MLSLLLGLATASFIDCKAEYSCSGKTFTGADLTFNCPHSESCRNIKVTSQGTVTLSCLNSSSCEGASINARNGVRLRCGGGDRACQCMEVNTPRDIDLLCLGKRACTYGRMNAGGDVRVEQCIYDQACEGIEITSAGKVSVPCHGTRDEMPCTHMKVIASEADVYCQGDKVCYEARIRADTSNVICKPNACGGMELSQNTYPGGGPDGRKGGRNGTEAGEVCGWIAPVTDPHSLFSFHHGKRADNEGVRGKDPHLLVGVALGGLLAGGVLVALVLVVCPRLGGSQPESATSESVEAPPPEATCVSCPGTCPVCFEVMESLQGGNAWMLAPCGHVVCRACCGMLRTDNCPVCRGKVKVIVKKVSLGCPQCSVPLNGLELGGTTTLAPCGHILCAPCANQNPKSCPVCGAGVQAQVPKAFVGVAGPVPPTSPCQTKGDKWDMKQWTATVHPA